MENEFIKILGMADWEDAVKELLEKYNIPENSGFEEGDRRYTLYTPSNFTWMSFDNNCNTPMQQERKIEGNYYLQSIVFHFDERKNEDNINVPFGLKHGDTYKDVIDKLGEPHLERDKFNKSASRLKKIWRLTKKNGELYQVVIDFNNQSKNFDLIEMGIWTIDPDKPISKYFVPHSYDPLKDK